MRKPVKLRPGSSMSQAHTVSSDVTEFHTEPNHVLEGESHVLDQEDFNAAAWEGWVVAIKSGGK